MSKPEIFEEMEYKGKLGEIYELLCFDIYNDYELYILSLGSHPTAYIVLNKNDKLYGLKMDELDHIPDIYCHGGFTYAEDTLTIPGYSYVNPYEKKWVIGWDYGHHLDWTTLLPEDIQKEYGFKKWTTEEIMKECHDVIDLIIAYNKKREDFRLKKFLIILSVIAILFLMIGCAAAEDVTVVVGCKHITGADGYADPLFLISTVECNGYYREISADYRVSPEDYYKVNVGDTVTLRVKDNKLGLCEIVTSENNKGWW